MTDNFLFFDFISNSRYIILPDAVKMEYMTFFFFIVFDLYQQLLQQILRDQRSHMELL